MPSKLREIYAGLQNQPIQVDGSNVPCIPLAESTGVINQTPVRVLSPLSDRNEGRGISNLTFGGGASLLWTITELVLVSPVQAGSGIENQTPYLVEYQENFVTAFASINRHLGISPATVTINNADMEIGIYNYPLGTDNWYTGLKITWTIRENL